MKANKRKGEDNNENISSTSEVNCVSDEIEKPESGFLTYNKKADKNNLSKVVKKRQSNIQNDDISNKDEPCDKASKTVTPFIAKTIITRSKANQKNSLKNKTRSKSLKNTQNKVKPSNKQRKKGLDDNYEKLNGVSEWINSGVHVKSDILKEKNVPANVLNSKTKDNAKFLEKKMSAQCNNQLSKKSKVVRGKRKIKEIKNKDSILSGHVTGKLKTKDDQVQQDIFGVSLHHID